MKRLRSIFCSRQAPSGAPPADMVNSPYTKTSLRRGPSQYPLLPSLSRSCSSEMAVQLLAHTSRRIDVRTPKYPQVVRMRLLGYIAHILIQYCVCISNLPNAANLYPKEASPTSGEVFACNPQVDIYITFYTGIHNPAVYNITPAPSISRNNEVNATHMPLQSALGTVTAAATPDLVLVAPG